MSPFRVALFVLGIAAAAGVVGAWEALTGPVPGFPKIQAFAAKTAERAPAPEPDLGAQLAVVRETVEHLGDELAKARGLAEAAMQKAAAVDRAHEIVAADFYSLAGELKKQPAREPRPTAKARRGQKPTNCAAEK